MSKEKKEKPKKQPRLTKQQLATIPFPLLRMICVFGMQHDHLSAFTAKSGELIAWFAGNLDRFRELDLSRVNWGSFSGYQAYVEGLQMYCRGDGPAPTLDPEMPDDPSDAGLVEYEDPVWERSDEDWQDEDAESSGLPDDEPETGADTPPATTEEEHMTARTVPPPRAAAAAPRPATAQPAAQPQQTPPRVGPGMAARASAPAAPPAAPAPQAPAPQTDGQVAELLSQVLSQLETVANNQQRLIDDLDALKEQLDTIRQEQGGQNAILLGLEQAGFILIQEGGFRPDLQALQELVPPDEASDEPAE